MTLLIFASSLELLRTARAKWHPTITDVKVEPPRSTQMTGRAIRFVGRHNETEETPSDSTMCGPVFMN